MTNSDACDNIVWISALTVSAIDDDHDEGDAVAVAVAYTASVDGDGNKNKCLPTTKIQFYDE